MENSLCSQSIKQTWKKQKEILKHAKIPYQNLFAIAYHQEGIRENN